MSRAVKDWVSEKVSDAEAAMREGDYTGSTAKEARETSPYKKGDVFLVLHDEKPKRARAIMVSGHYLRTQDQYVPRYRVQLETSKGVWSKLWNNVWPGDIQRGFEAAEQLKGEAQ